MRRSPRRRRRAATLEGLSWAAWWLDDAEAVFDARERAYRLYRDAGRRCRRRADGNVARGRRVGLPRRRHGRRRVAPARPAAARAARRRPGSRLARLPRGLRRARERRRRARRRARASPRPSSDAASVSPTWRCSASASRERRWSRRPRSRTGCAASTRRPRRRWRGRRRSRSRAPGPAASSSARARRCRTTSAPPSGATGSPSSPSATAAATCSASAGRSTAPCTSGAGAGPRRRSCWRARSRRSPARGRRTQAARSPSWRSSGGGRAGLPRPSRWSSERAHRTARSSVAPGSRSMQAIHAPRPSWSSGCGRRDPGPDQAPLLELLLRASIADGELDSAATALAELRALAQRVGTGPLQSCGRPRRGHARRRARRPRTRAHAARGRG